MNAIEVKMKTPITYYGGKQKMLKIILPMIPEHDIYVEPFFGGRVGTLSPVVLQYIRQYVEVCEDAEYSEATATSERGIFGRLFVSIGAYLYLLPRRLRYYQESRPRGRVPLRRPALF